MITAEKVKTHDKLDRDGERGPAKGRVVQLRLWVWLRSKEGLPAVRFLRDRTVRASRVRVCELVECCCAGRACAQDSGLSSGVTEGCSGRGVLGKPPPNVSGAAAVPGPGSAGS
eukprot:5317630-Prymnesium_polylepis.1